MSELPDRVRFRQSGVVSGLVGEESLRNLLVDHYRAAIERYERKRQADRSEGTISVYMDEERARDSVPLAVLTKKADQDEPSIKVDLVQLRLRGVIAN